MFLSYRRQDAAFQADMLYRLLVAAFGPERVFKDVDSIEPGDDFALAIEQAVASCTVLLAVIGDRWLAAVDGAGTRRLDDPGDFVRLEIESALRAGVRVVPVLLGAELPAPEQLPPSLAELASRQAVVLAPQGFMDGAQRLVERLAALGRPGRAPAESVAPVPEPPPADAGATRRPSWCRPPTGCRSPTSRRRRCAGGTVSWRCWPPSAPGRSPTRGARPRPGRARRR